MEFSQKNIVLPSRPKIEVVKTGLTQSEKDIVLWKMFKEGDESAFIMHLLK